MYVAAVNSISKYTIEFNTTLKQWFVRNGNAFEKALSSV